MVMPPSVPPERPLTRRMPSSVGTISSCASEPGVAASAKPSPTSTPLIAWMPMSAPASRESSRRSQCTCEPSPGGRPCTTTSTTPPRVSPSSWAWSIRSTICLPVSGSRQRTGSSSSRATSSGSRPEAVGGADAAELDHVGDDPGADRLLQEVGRDPAQRDPRRRLAGRGALEDRAGLVEGVLLHARQVGVAGPGPGQGRVARRPLELGRVDRVGGHDLLPLGPLGVADLDRDRAALGLAVPDAADERDLVLLELHPGAAAVAEPAPRQRVADVVGGHPHVGGQPLEDRDEGRAVGLTRGQPAQGHAQRFSQP